MEEKIRVLVDLRPALQGFAGIPQEVRLLFRGLCLDKNLHIEGFLQTDNVKLAFGLPPDTACSADQSNGEQWETARRFHALAQVVISASECRQRVNRTAFEVIRDWITNRIQTFKLVYGSLKIELGKFESRYFEDFVWRYIFAKTLPSSDFALVTSKNHRVCPVSWEKMQDAGLDTLSISSTPHYPEISTSDFDVFIAQTPYPGRVSSNTTMVVRYHDAIPVFLPHTIPGKSKHEAIHFHALMSNVKEGAWFSCVSDTSRRDLLRLFPEAAARAVTIYNMVSPQYFLENSSFEEVRKIIPLRRSLAASSDEDQSNDYMSVSPKFKSSTEEASFFSAALQGDFRYLLVVSTIDPRKNHATCIAAWQTIKRKKDPNLKLVFVGSLGWDYRPLTKDLTSELANGDLFLLDSVPASELRLLYRHASATVCPSFSEGFDFSGVEAMRCGGVVVASDIAVHREVYEDAAEYFDPYSSDSAVGALTKVLYDRESEQIQSRLRSRGERVSERYLPENIMPKWKSFLDRVADCQIQASKPMDAARIAG